ncbi:hypothetical protein [Rhodococcus globerulus]|uniref:Transposase n=1 Tax=Rhodococcus globerulus TaxID=33008 RepID=A0ABU4C3Q1_RHOGO|nr:hypothetical protein [Rhodococcus globerulus]MDV6271135.1 hypothetical protein [Rhodococcus globerulus]
MSTVGGYVCGIVPRVAERGGLLGRCRWEIERTVAWPVGYRRSAVRYVRCGKRFAAFLYLALALVEVEELST